MYDTLKQMFGEEKLKQSVNPSECVAKGGCMSIVNPIKREEITSYSLGSTIKGNQVTWVLPKHSKIPAEYSERFANSYDNQTTFSGFLVQGESLEAGVTESLTDSMTMLKRYVYSGVTPMPMGQSPVRETYYMKEPDIVLIDAVDELSGKKLLDHAEFVCN